MGVVLVTLAVPGEFTPSRGKSLKPFLNLVKEVSQYRRLNILHPNPQSIFDGHLLGVVHTTSGNLTFQRRDLVAWLNGPVTIARVYDSRIADNPDFGRGWRLSVAEELRVGEDQTIRYTDGSGTSYRFVPSSSGYVVSPPTPRHNRSILSMDNGTATLEMDDGSVRRFIQNGFGSPYRLAALDPAGGPVLRFSYIDGLLNAIERNGEVVFQLERNADGKIASVADLHGRAVQYSYRRDGLLAEVRDIAGQRWKHQYDIQGRLIEAIGPNHLPYLRIVYDSQGRVLESDTGQMFAFTYSGRVTEAMEAASRRHVFEANHDGVTTEYSSSSGVAWQLELDDRNRVTELSSNGHEYRYAYRADGLLERMRSKTPDGADELEYAYDSHGRLSQVASTVTKDRIAISHEDGWTRIDGPSLDFRFETRNSRIASIVGNDRREWEIDYRNAAITGIHRGARSLYLLRDSASRIVAIGYPDQRVSRYGYDALGNRRLLDWGARGSTRYGHDAAGNIVEVEVTHADGTKLRQRTRIGEMNTVEEVDYEGSSTLSVSYDGMRRPITFDIGDDTVRVSYRADGEVDSLRSKASGERWLNDRKESLPPPLPPPYRRALSPDDPAPAGPRHRVVDFHPVTLHPMASDPLELGVPGLVEARAILAVAAPLFGEDPARARREFEKPSNPVFQPLEHQSTNCCVECFPCVEICRPENIEVGVDTDGDGEIDEIRQVEHCYCLPVGTPGTGSGGGNDDKECEEGEECEGEEQECPEGEECHECPDEDGDGECVCRDTDGNGVCDCDDDGDGACDCPYGANEDGHCHCRDDDENEGKGDGVCDDCEDENSDRICDCPDEDENGECDCEDSDNDGVCDCPEDEDEDGECDCLDIDNDGECDPLCESRATISIFGGPYVQQHFIPRDAVGFLARGRNCVGRLTLALEGGGDHSKIKDGVDHGVDTIEMDREDIPGPVKPEKEIRYTGLTLTWKVPNQLWTPWVREGYEFSALGGEYTHTQYNIPEEANPTCSTGAKKKAYIVKENSQGATDCWDDYEETKLPQKFYDETAENGTGISKKYGPLQLEEFCLDHTDNRPSDLNLKPKDKPKEKVIAFRDIHGQIKPSCPGGTLNNATVAVDLESKRSVFDCGDQFFATRSSGNDAKKTVTDGCGRCTRNAKKPIPKNQVDHFLINSACSGIGEWGSGGKTFKLPW